MIKHRQTIGICVVSFVLLLISCTQQQESHFLKDDKYRNKVEAKFKERQKQYKEVDSFKQIDHLDLNLEEKEALMFLYAYMPLSDIADYEPNFFVNQVKGALRAKDYFEWGSNSRLYFQTLCIGVSDQ